MYSSLQVFSVDIYLGQNWITFMCLYLPPKQLPCVLKIFLRNIYAEICWDFNIDVQTTTGTSFQLFMFENIGLKYLQINVTTDYDSITDHI